MNAIIYIPLYWAISDFLSTPKRSAPSGNTTNSKNNSEKNNKTLEFFLLEWNNRGTS
eukprot:TRINITY_DN12203_c0_g1_i1.p2 TRINITY_DN12203_c0_g1~~TRINITY_DN12203_c0_g1_i1.p2  ORF type:complete len:57 (-),score=4.89 TRINITY_DN12203_c0_g1_i1:240-410(-)